ncbi:hypothetical protein [Bradyrhizobium sp. Tv2a-2]|uniref:hypothetical protein n=1 Tax=Bradyrhizobium sp. Tv2a-2 TaxID=113395 RepID=UPI000465477E|nr:hypothetical protein [Bradyrhizobium sp. Tv2a-2]
MAPNYATGNTPLNVPVATMVTFYKELVQAGKLNDYVQAAGATSIGIPPITIGKVLGLLGALAAANVLDDFVTLAGDKLVPVDPATINAGKDFLFNNNIHTASQTASAMVNTDGDCPGNHCPYIVH